MKIKKPDGTIEEVADDYTLEEGEEKVEEEEEEGKTMLKSLEKAINSKVQEIIEATKLGGKLTKEIPGSEISVMNPDLLMRKKAPFVKLSKQMEDFIADIKSLAKGGIPRSMIKALTEGDDTAGGFLVPEEFNAEIIRYVTEAAIVRPRARVFSMTRDIMGMPKLDQSTDQFGGVALSWIGESGLKGETQPKFGKITLNAKKLIGLTPVSDELLEDNAVNLANFLVTLFGEAVAYEEDKKFLVGTGMATPLGIIVGAGTVVNRTTASRIKIADVLSMWENLPAWATPGAVWLTTKAGYTQFLKMRADAITAGDEAGAMLFVPSMAGGLPPSLLDLPILITDKLPALGTKGDLVLANIGWYFIGDRGPLAVASSIHDRFRYDETTFRFVKRVDGQPGIDKAFVVLN